MDAEELLKQIEAKLDAGESSQTHAPPPKDEPGRELRYYEPEKLKPIHQRMAVMAAAGYQNNEIAEILEVTPAWVSTCLNTPITRELKDRLTADLITKAAEELNDKFVGDAVEARLHALALMRTAKNEGVRMRAVEFFTERALGKPKEYHFNSNITATNTQMERLVSTLELMQQPVAKREPVGRAIDAILNSVSNGSSDTESGGQSEAA